MSVDYEQVVKMQYVAQGEVEHEVTVRSINGGYNCRVFIDGKLNQEGRTMVKSHIGAVCRDLLRWEDKCGNISEMARGARHRNKL